MRGLSDAAKLNPLSDRAYLVEGSIALRFGDLARARDAFSKALKRVPDDAYATLELGAIASEMGARAGGPRIARTSCAPEPPRPAHPRRR